MSRPSSSPLFSPSLIPEDYAASLKPGYTLRPLCRSDYARGFLTCLSDLTRIGEVDEATFNERYDWLATKGQDWYYCIVVDDGKQIVATATMIVERKFIKDLTTVAHVEEVCVLKSEQGKGLGIATVKAMGSVAESLGVETLMLDCAERTVEFYQKCGYHRAGQQMSLKIGWNPPRDT